MLQDNPILNEILKNKKLLIVDDDELFSEIFKEMLEDWFLYIYIADNAKEALDVLGDVPFDLVITDIEMPEMDGTQLCHEIKKRFPHQDLVVASSHSSEPYLIKLLTADIQGYLKKPFKLETLKKVLENIYIPKGATC